MLEVEPDKAADATVIFLHGLGADGSDFAGIVPYLGLASGHRVRFVLPSAPSRPVSLNGGLVMPAWFDVGLEDLRQSELSDRAGLESAERQVHAWIEREEARGIPSRRIVVGGFSQGGALACWTALRFTKPLAGAIALSTFLARNARLEAGVAPANRGLAVFAAHGTRDPLVPASAGRALRTKLEELGCAVEWREYPMAHEVCLEELAALGAWITARLA